MVVPEVIVTPSEAKTATIVTTDEVSLDVILPA